MFHVKHRIAKRCRAVSGSPPVRWWAEAMTALWWRCTSRAYASASPASTLLTTSASLCTRIRSRGASVGAFRPSGLKCPRADETLRDFHSAGAIGLITGAAVDLAVLGIRIQRVIPLGLAAKADTRLLQHVVHPETQERLPAIGEAFA